MKMLRKKNDNSYIRLVWSNVLHRFARELGVHRPGSFRYLDEFGTVNWVTAG